MECFIKISIFFSPYKATCFRVIFEQDGVSAVLEQWFFIHLMIDNTQNQSDNAHRVARGQRHSSMQLTSGTNSYKQRFVPTNTYLPNK